MRSTEVPDERVELIEPLGERLLSEGVGRGEDP